MMDATTKKPLRVSTAGTARPYIRVPVSRLDEVRRLLGSRGIDFVAEEQAISLDGGPEFVVINLERGADVVAVQALLDSVH